MPSETRRGSRIGGLARSSDGGFSLVELMIVVIIIGILASVAVPLMQSGSLRAKASECTAHLGSLRAAMRSFYAEHGTYNTGSFYSGDIVTSSRLLDVSESDLGGRYFSVECYTFNGAPTDSTFSVECDGASSTAPAADEVGAVLMYINQLGDITRG